MLTNIELTQCELRCISEALRAQLKTITPGDMEGMVIATLGIRIQTFIKEFQSTIERAADSTLSADRSLEIINAIDVLKEGGTEILKAGGILH